jgi:hypothetical protein
LSAVQKIGLVAMRCYVRGHPPISCTPPSLFVLFNGKSSQTFQKSNKSRFTERA